MSVERVGIKRFDGVEVLSRDGSKRVLDGQPVSLPRGRLPLSGHDPHKLAAARFKRDFGRQPFVLLLQRHGAPLARLLVHPQEFDAALAKSSVASCALKASGSASTRNRFFFGWH